MTSEEAILRIEDHMIIHKLKEVQSVHITEALNMAISALKEIQQYRSIGTVEEFREAREKQKPKKPVLSNDNGRLRKGCPVCGCFFSPLSRNCPKCGQAIKYED